MARKYMNSSNKPANGSQMDRKISLMKYNINIRCGGVENEISDD